MARGQGGKTAKRQEGKGARRQEGNCPFTVLLFFVTEFFREVYL
jgi:hypothetical protein